MILMGWPLPGWRVDVLYEQRGPAPDDVITPSAYRIGPSEVECALV